jgi:hypothetical protein
MGLVAHARNEMQKAGLFDKDADYGGAIGKAVMELVEAFAKQGHSGFSAGYTLDVFEKVARFKTLTAVTSDPEEWTNVSEYYGPESPAVWQSKRDPSLFSNDGGKTYYSVENKKRALITAAEPAA